MLKAEGSMLKAQRVKGVFTFQVDQVIAHGW